MKTSTIILSIYSFILTIILVSHYEERASSIMDFKDEYKSCAYWAFGKDWMTANVSDLLPLWNKLHPAWPIKPEYKALYSIHMIGEYYLKSKEKTEGM